LNSLRLFRASPEGFFATLDVKLKELESQVAEVQAQLKGIADIADAFIHDLPVRIGAAPAPTNWTYQALLPNVYFDDVFEPEANPQPKRWVGISGRLAWTLRLPRIAQYDFAVQCIDFTSEAMRATFRLQVNGTVYPWLEAADGLHRTIILDAPDEADLSLELSIDPATRPPETDVTFSFARIDIQRRG